jgi:hypothetical protein
MSAGIEGAGRGILSNISFIHSVIRAATKLLNVLGGELNFDVVNALCLASNLYILRRVMPFFEMRKPVVCHELNPIRRKHIEERRLLVIAVCIL